MKLPQTQVLITVRASEVQHESVLEVRDIPPEKCKRVSQKQYAVSHPKNEQKILVR